MPSLVKAVRENAGEKEKIHLFEMANVYLPKKKDLPQEKMYLSGIFDNTSFRNAKGVVEGLLSSLHIDNRFVIKDQEPFLQNHRLEVVSNKKTIGQFGVLPGDLLYYEFEVEALKEIHKPMPKYKPIPKYPAHVEDITIVVSEKSKIGELLEVIQEEMQIVDAQLTEIYENAYTFRLWYQDPDKTLTDVEVAALRTNVLDRLRKKHGVAIKG